MLPRVNRMRQQRVRHREVTSTARKMLRPHRPEQLLERARPNPDVQPEHTRPIQIRRVVEFAIVLRDDGSERKLLRAREAAFRIVDEKGRFGSLLAVASAPLPPCHPPLLELPASQRQQRHAGHRHDNGNDLEGECPVRCVIHVQLLYQMSLRPRPEANSDPSLVGATLRDDDERRMYVNRAGLERGSVPIVNDASRWPGRT